MGNLLNLSGETGAGIITDDTAGAGLRFENTGAATSVQIANSSTGIAADVIGGSGSTANPAVRATFSANVAGATVAPLNVTASTASQAVLSISGVFMSTASINVLPAKSAFIIPVYHETQRVWGYLTASIGVS